VATNQVGTSNNVSVGKAATYNNNVSNFIGDDHRMKTTT
jgi:hypothetical protein